ncbi:FAD-dependent monooxygenase [Streptomyces sp. ME19-01-6]|uniref:FAD-dependent monooxygenase n=1 Tax=Streptomyces sp. ME19-01-6 TaxID=3028686 RepID=UPI0029A8616F|nr:FAD-dependent monooxygenase [Streptomyces sp. ME19-01-6]MDX3232134.1 FAD-dependent monooxygenase [Streptomyces sp. ME19-01-6]
MKTVLISGAGLAGPALAYWLRHHGFAPTVVERAPAPRTGGQAVDIRGVALEVVRRMGLLERARELRTRMRGMSVLDGEGNEIERSTDKTYSSGRLDSDDIELLREDLTGLLYERTRDGAEYVFGDGVAALQQDEYGVRVEFESGRSRGFDLVVGADGQHSTVRGLVFGPEEEFAHPLGMQVAIFRADNFLGLEEWQLWLRDGAAGYGIYPVRDNSELRITFGWAAAGPQEQRVDHRDIEGQKRALADRMAAVRWEAPRMLKAMWEASDFYSDAMAQIRMDRWSHGRVALLGDAGYCASPLSGQGTSLALVGAYVLADALGRAEGDHRAAYDQYERRMRPFVLVNQALATENPGGPASEASVERAKNAISL